MIATARTLNPWITLAVIVCVCAVLAWHRWVAPRIIRWRHRQAWWTRQDYDQWDRPW